MHLRSSLFLLEQYPFWINQKQTSLNSLLRIGKQHGPTGRIILFHSELLWHTHLATVIKGYDFFDYALFEALHISENEEIF